MKKLLFILSLIFTLTACSQNNLPKEIVDIDWYRPTEDCGEIISFDKDQSFHYWEDCGNPVDDSDLYDKYSYNEETKTITVTSSEGAIDLLIKIVSFDDNKLVLDFDGEIGEFKKESE